MRFFKPLLYLLVSTAVLVAVGAVRVPVDVLSPRTGPSLSSAQNWGYQLQHAAPERVPAEIDVMVVDAARGPRPADTLAREDVARFQARPDGTRRIVLAYLSIGEAESYRYYWQAHWRTNQPSWLALENKQWRENYRVRFWEPAWQDIFFKRRQTVADRLLERLAPSRKRYLDRIIEAGFDGVYLDRVDAFYEWEATRPSAESEMAAFVAALADYARTRRPGFLIIPQNAEELLRDDGYRRVIDAIAKEDLFFGLDGAERENAPDDVQRSVALLDHAKQRGLPVFVVEYVSSATKRSNAERRARDLGYRIQFADRLLANSPELPLPSPSDNRPPLRP
jgi:cysteinyl-tRNA synthetase